MGEFEEKKFNYYCFTFKGNVPDGRPATASSYAGYQIKPNFGKGEIRKQKSLSGLTDDAVLISITFLGVMTEEEFTS